MSIPRMPSWTEGPTDLWNMSKGVWLADKAACVLGQVDGTHCQRRRGRGDPTLGADATPACRENGTGFWHTDCRGASTIPKLQPLKTKSLDTRASARSIPCDAFSLGDLESLARVAPCTGGRKIFRGYAFCA